MHICYLTIDYHSSERGGGIASYLRVISQALVERGHAVTILTLGKGDKEVFEGGVRIVEVACANLHWYYFKLASCKLASWATELRDLTLPIREIEWSYTLWKTLQAQHRLKPIDVVEATELGNFFYNPQRHPPLIVRCHGSSWAINRAEGRRTTFGMWADRVLERQGIRRARFLSAVSQFHAQALQAEFEGSTSPIEVIYNPVNPTLLTPPMIPDPVKLDKTDIDKDKNIIFYAGRIEHNKGLYTLFEAMQLVRQQIPNVELVLAGRRHPSISDQELNNAIAPLRVPSSCVRLLGHVQWSEMVNWYQQAQIFVMPSLYETFCLSVAEAMACQRPVVATTAGALSELVVDGVTGKLVEPGNAHALAIALIDLLHQPDVGKQMGQAGQKRVRQLFSLAQLVEQSLSIYTRSAHQ